MNRHAGKIEGTGVDTSGGLDVLAGRRPHIMTLILLSAVSPVAMNLFIPSMPSIARDLDAPYATVQLGLSLYLIMTAAMQLLIGPLSDFYGRRPVIQTGLLLFLVGTAMCIFAQNVEVFLAGRIVQSGSAAGMVLSRAIVRDIYPREKSASMIGYMVMGMAIAPMIGPAIGGFIDQVSGWRMSFAVLGAFGLIAVIACLLNLPETNRFRGAPIAEQMKSYRTLARMPVFWLYACIAGFSSALFFAYLGGGPAVATEHHGLEPFVYGLYFGVCALGYSIGNFLAGRYSERIGLEPMMLRGVLVSLLGPLVAIALITAGVDHPAAFFLPLSLVGLGNGMTLPNVMAAAISLKQDAAGAASGLLGTVQIGIGAIASIVAGLIAGPTGAPLPLCLFLAACGVAAIFLTMIAAKPGRRA